MGEEEDSGRIRDPQPHQIVLATENTASYWKERCDQFEDPFAMVATRDSLKPSMEKVEELGMALSVSQRERGEFETEYGLNDMKSFLFGNIVFYFPSLNTDEDDEQSPSLTEVQAKFYGGLVEEELTDSVTHVVVDSCDSLGQGEGSCDSLQGIKDVRRERLQQGKKLFYLVSERWVEESVRMSKLVGEEEFML